MLFFCLLPITKKWLAIPANGMVQARTLRDARTLCVSPHDAIRDYVEQRFSDSGITNTGSEKRQDCQQILSSFVGDGETCGEWLLI